MIPFPHSGKRNTVKQYEQGEAGEEERPADWLTACWVQSPTWGLIPGPWDHDLTWSQMLNWLSHPGTPFFFFFPFLNFIILAYIQIIVWKWISAANKLQNSVSIGIYLPDKEMEDYLTHVNLFHLESSSILEETTVFGHWFNHCISFSFFIFFDLSFLCFILL